MERLAHTDDPVQCDRISPVSHERTTLLEHLESDSSSDTGFCSSTTMETTSLNDECFPKNDADERMLECLPCELLQCDEIKLNAISAYENGWNVPENDDIRSPVPESDGKQSPVSENDGKPSVVVVWQSPSPRAKEHKPQHATPVYTLIDKFKEALDRETLRTEEPEVVARSLFATPLRQCNSQVDEANQLRVSASSEKVLDATPTDSRTSSNSLEIINHAEDTLPDRGAFLNSLENGVSDTLKHQQQSGSDIGLHQSHGTETTTSLKRQPNSFYINLPSFKKELCQDQAELHKSSSESCNIELREPLSITFSKLTSPITIEDENDDGSVSFIEQNNESSDCSVVFLEENTPNLSVNQPDSESDYILLDECDSDLESDTGLKTLKSVVVPITDMAKINDDNFNSGKRRWNESSNSFPLANDLRETLDRIKRSNESAQRHAPTVLPQEPVQKVNCSPEPRPCPTSNVWHAAATASSSSIVQQPPSDKVRAPFHSSDPAENWDIVNPDWSEFRALKTEEEWFQKVRRMWNSRVMPSLHRNLTFHSYRARRAREEGCSVFGQSEAKRKRSPSPGPHRQSKRARTGSETIPCTFLLDETIGRHPSARGRFITKLKLAREEISKVGHYYDGMNLSKRQEDEQLEQRRMYQLYDTHYSPNSEMYYF